MDNGSLMEEKGLFHRTLGKGIIYTEVNRLNFSFKNNLQIIIAICAYEESLETIKSNNLKNNWLSYRKGKIRYVGFFQFPRCKCSHTA